MWCLLEFLYNGFLRPVDYLVHLLTEVSNGFLWGIRMFTMTVNQNNNLRREFDSLASEHGKKLWPMFPSLVDLSCYYDYIIDVDKHHFPGIHDANSCYERFELELSKIDSLPTSIRKQFSSKVLSYFQDRPSKSSSAHISNGKYAQMSLAVRKAVYEQILPVVKHYGMDPYIKDVDPEILNSIAA